MQLPAAPGTPNGLKSHPRPSAFGAPEPQQEEMALAAVLPGLSLDVRQVDAVSTHPPTGRQPYCDE
jgi:hypothetical protein